MTTLNHYNPRAPQQLIRHGDFTEALTREFAKVYALDGTPAMPNEIDDLPAMREDAKFRKVYEGVKELKSWEWTYGSSPEFSNVIEGHLSLGSVVSTGGVFRPKHIYSERVQ